VRGNPLGARRARFAFRPRATIDCYVSLENAEIAMSIWGKRQEEGPLSRTAPPAPTPVEPKKESLPVSSTPNPSLRTHENDTRGAATIGKAVKVVGQIFSKEDLFVDGDVEGAIELNEHKLTIGPNGKVNSAVKAREVVVLGSIQGNVDAAERLEIKKDARLVGDIKTARIVIEDGAYFKGSIDIVRVEQKQASQPKAPPAPVPPPAAAPVAAEAKR
jgi:cytoskeletal protein CcmA (bactofilin family)